MMAPNSSLKGRKAPADGDGPRDRSAAAIQRRPGSPPPGAGGPARGRHAGCLSRLQWHAMYTIPPEGSPPTEDVVPFLVVDRRAGRH